MKKFILFVTLFISFITFSQTMNIHKTDGVVDNYEISEIDSITFTLPESDLTVTDIDGNVYSTVTICDQVWMAENLKVTHYRNGEPITLSTSWSEEEAYCNYDNNDSYVDPYGRLYNWYALNDSRGLAPEGWHIPTDEEWYTLITCLGGEDVAGGKLKEAGTEHWISNNTGTTNESGFTALPSGERSDSGAYWGMGYYTHFWTSTEAVSSSHARYWRIHSTGLLIVTAGAYKRSGFSVRCVKD